MWLVQQEIHKLRCWFRSSRPSMPASMIFSSSFLDGCCSSSRHTHLQVTGGRKGWTRVRQSLKQERRGFFRNAQESSTYWSELCLLCIQSRTIRVSGKTWFRHLNIQSRRDNEKRTLAFTPYFPPYFLELRLWKQGWERYQN